jgi:GNAT superfamily N-acetyltransferase
MDGPAFFELRRDAIRAGCADHYGSSQLEAWTSPLSDGSLRRPLPEHFYFALIEARIVGSGLLDISTGRIDAMFVLPPFFGRGIGRAMMRHLESIARIHGLKTLTLDATLNAAAFYRSQGFEGEITGTYQSTRGISLECIRMKKSLEGS